MLSAFEMKKTLLGLAILLVPGTTYADPPPQVGTLQGFNVLGKGANHLQGDQDRIQAGGPLRLALVGSGTCEVEIQVSQGANTLWTRKVEAKMPFNYVSDFAMPPYAYKHEDFLVKVIPLSTKNPTKVCVGATYSATVDSVCRTPICYSSLHTPPPPPPPPTPPPPVLGGGFVPVPTSKPANGAITSLGIPGGSFAADETQKIHVAGSGGCAMDLHISNKTYGGTFDKTFSVNPINLAGTANLYNGTHFDTLYAGSWTADATGKGGCTGKATIDFKVTASSVVGQMNGKPTVKIDKPPQTPGVFTLKDSNIWFKVDVPSDFQVLSGVGCCEIEFDYKNSYGGWEPSTLAPVTDPGWNPATNNHQPAPKSVSYFKVPGESALEWRVRVRGYYYHYVFNWSDWTEFKVSQQ